MIANKLKLVKLGCKYTCKLPNTGIFSFYHEEIPRGEARFIPPLKKGVRGIFKILRPTGTSFKKGGIKLSPPIDFTIQKNSDIKLNFLINNNKLANFNFNLIGNNSKLEVNVVHLGQGDNNCELNFNMLHHGINCRSRLNIRRVQFGSSESVCHAMIKIDEKATGSDAYLSDKSLLIGDKSKAESIPSLEILTNNVKASHGATIGRLSNEDMFYLRSRGLSEKQAKQVLITGFINSILPQGSLVQKLISAKLKSYI
ncbi:MAG: SufD family Fe-S cluster assembly protein [Patescibacteria group bacterium]